MTGYAHIHFAQFNRFFFFNCCFVIKVRKEKRKEKEVYPENLHEYFYCYVKLAFLGLTFKKILVLLSPLREIQVALPGSGTAAARAALPIPISVWSIFVCLNSGVADSVWDF